MLHATRKISSVWLNFVLAFIVILWSGVYFSYYFEESRNISINVPSSGTATVNQEIKEQIDSSAERKYWDYRMKEIGTALAYAEFKSKYADKHFGVQHMAAHVVGELIYEHEGVDGLTICDSDFAFGCYHSFFGRALAENGPSIIGRLDQACVDKYGPLGSGCQHGLGHGLVEFYTPKNLLKALESCDGTTQAAPLAGCTSGVFMEYNMPILIDDRGAKSGQRPFNPDEPYTPCPTLPVKYRDSCYYEIGQWWNNTPGIGKEYSRLGNLCSDISDSSNRKSCFLGLGNAFGPSSNYNVEATKSACNNMPTDAGRVSCLSGGSWSFYANPTYRHLASQLCEGLDPKTAPSCISDSRIVNEQNR